MHGSEDLAITPLLPLRRYASLRRAASTTTVLRDIVIATSDRSVDGRLEDLMHAVHLLGRAFHVHCAHLLSDGTALLLCDWCQALCFQQLDACSFVSQIGFEAAEDDWCGWTEVEDFGIPL